MYGSGRFCSAKCSRTWSSMQHRQETNEKVSHTLLSRRKYCRFKTDFTIRYCSDCGKQLEFRNKSGRCMVCNTIAMHKNPEYREKLKRSQLNLVASGKHKGWTTRNIKSYAEQFFETVLTNNHIIYAREVHVGKYFLDFVVGDIDIEIDGKQHQYTERARSDILRDDYLRRNGYFVYRIKWNEINSASGKEMMRDKIGLLLDFLTYFDYA